MARKEFEFLSDMKEKQSSTSVVVSSESSIEKMSDLVQSLFSLKCFTICGNPLNKPVWECIDAGFKRDLAKVSQ